MRVVDRVTSVKSYCHTGFSVVLTKASQLARLDDMPMRKMRVVVIQNGP